MRTRSVRRLTLCALAAGAAALLPTTAAWAPHVAQLKVNPTTMKPGQEVDVFGPSGFGRTNPVEIRFNAADGPVLGTFQPTCPGASACFAPWGPGKITIPADTKPGQYALWVTQKLADDEKLIRGMPTKTLIQVVPEGGAPVVANDLTPQIEPRPATLEENEPVGIGPLVLVGLGTAGMAMFAAGAAALFSSRRRPTATPQTVRTDAGGRR